MIDRLRRRTRKQRGIVTTQLQEVHILGLLMERLSAVIFVRNEGLLRMGYFRVSCEISWQNSLRKLHSKFV